MKVSQLLCAFAIGAAALAISSASFANQTPVAVAPSAATPAANPSVGAPTTSAPDANAPTAVASLQDDARRVCRDRETLGSRLRSIKVCRTQAEWRRLDNEGRTRAKTLTEQRPDGLRDPRMGGG
jgi:hypothetical protein